MMRDQCTQPIVDAATTEELGPVDRVESEAYERWSVPDVVQPCCPHQQIRIVDHSCGTCRLSRNALYVSEPTRERH